MFKKIKEKKVYQDPWLEFFQDEIEFPDGSRGTYAWAKRKDGVGIVVVTGDNKILLHKEYRYVIKDYSWEIQGGGIDEGESLEEAARRELKEETGIEAKKLVMLGTYYPLHSFNTEKVTLFLAKVKNEDVNLESTEVSERITEQKFVTFDEALEMIDSEKINDAGTANAVQMAIRRIRADK